MGDLDDTLAHYGIRGMRWGVRKNRSSPTETTKEPVDVTIKSYPGGKIQTSGGHNQPPHDDAKRASAYRQQARVSGPNSLSNAQLKALIERIRLENDYNKIRAAEIEAAKSPSRRFLEKFIKSERDTVLKGKKPQTQQGIEMLIAMQKKRATRTTAKKITTG